MRALLSLALLGGCFADVRVGGSSPVGRGPGGFGADIGVGLGGEHRGERIRAGGGLHLGGRVDEENGFIPVGAMGRIDVGLTNPNEHGGRVIATGQLALGFARGYSGSGDESAQDGEYAQMFLGIGIGATRSNERRRLEAGHVALGLLATRFFPEQGDSYWMIGAALSFSLGLNIGKVSDAFSGDD